MFRNQGSRFRVWVLGLGFGVEDLSFRVKDFEGFEHAKSPRLPKNYRFRE